nr:unnamed protein product [Callosobruchus chinensis]
MKIFLRYVDDPGYQTGVAEDIGDLQTSVSKVVTKVSDQIVEKCGRWIKFPSTPADETEAKRRWQRKYTFPGAVGVIDCTHIKIKKRLFMVMNILIASDIIASMFRPLAMKTSGLQA